MAKVLVKKVNGKGIWLSETTFRKETVLSIIATVGPFAGALILYFVLILLMNEKTPGTLGVSLALVTVTMAWALLSPLLSPFGKNVQHYIVESVGFDSQIEKTGEYDQDWKKVCAAVKQAEERILLDDETHEALEDLAKRCGGAGKT